MKQDESAKISSFSVFDNDNNVDVADVKGCHVGHETKNQGILFEILLLEKRLMH